MAGILYFIATEVVSTGDGDFFSPDNSLVTPRIKHLESGAFFDAPLDSNGRYVATNGGAGCPDGYYVAYDGSTELGHIWGTETAPGEGGTWKGDGALGYLPIDATATFYDAGNKVISNGDSAVAGTDFVILDDMTDAIQVLQDYVEANFVDITTDQGITSHKTFVTDCPSSNIAPTVDAHLTRKDYVDDLVGAISVIPFQESVNKIRLIQGGSTVTGQVYTTWNDAAGYLVSQTPSTTKRYEIEISGHGITGSTNVVITENDGGTPVTYYFNNYCSVKCTNRLVTLLLPNDVVGTNVTAHTVVLEGGTLYFSNVLGTPTIQNMRFVNVYFDITSLSIVFTNCRFENCFLAINNDSDGSATFTTCRGSGVTSNQEFGSSAIDGWIKPKADF